MNIEWHGQSAFTLRGSERSVLIDPFDQRLRPEGMSIRFDYPQIPQQQVDLLLITHEHFDHNGAAVADGSPHVVRSTAGTLRRTPVGEVIAIASEHDDQAGTRRGPNTIFVFALDGIRICHMGDFGQAALRPEQREAIGTVDLLFVPVGGGPTIGAERRGRDHARARPALGGADALPHRPDRLPRAGRCLPGRVRRCAHAGRRRVRPVRRARRRATPGRAAGPGRRPGIGRAADTLRGVKRYHVTDLRLPDERARLGADQGPAGVARPGGGARPRPRPTCWCSTPARSARRPTSGFVAHLMEARAAKQRDPGQADRRRRLLVGVDEGRAVRAATRSSTSRSARAPSTSWATTSPPAASCRAATSRPSTSFAGDLPASRERPHQAWLQISQGCNSRAATASCPACAGASRAGRWHDLVGEARRLAADGVRELTLLGQNVNS